MIRFNKNRRRCEELKAEVEEAKQQLKRAEEAESRVKKLTTELHSHVRDNHLGERLRLAFEQSSRRRRHGTT
jgi:cell shape-determining protein MreC